MDFLFTSKFLEKECIKITTNNTVNGATIFGSDESDFITNRGSNVSIISGEGDDTINDRGFSVSINAGSGDNVINIATYSYNRYDDFIEAGDGNNYVNNDTVTRATAIIISQ